MFIMVNIEMNVDEKSLYNLSNKYITAYKKVYLHHQSTFSCSFSELNIIIRNVMWFLLFSKQACIFN
jgi:hypothetical protein